MMQGVVNIYKPVGPTSHDMVFQLRKIFKMKRIGHTGTLDPLAEGVLPLCVGDATRLVEYLTGVVKVYRTVLRLGYTSDTYDITGALQETPPFQLSRADFLAALEPFRGSQKQLPPMYSAISVQGVRLYELARQGIEIEREAREITIFALEALEVPAQLSRHSLVTLELRCSKGTYVRSLVHDLGQALGCGAVMEHLVRLQSGCFSAESALSMEQVKELAEAGRAEEAFVRLTPAHLAMPALGLTAQELAAVANGKTLERSGAWQTGEQILLVDEASHTLRAIAKAERAADPEICLLRPAKVLANPLAFELN